MHVSSIFGARRAVCGGSDKWVRELNAPTHLEQPGADCGVGSSHLETEPLSCTLEQQWVADGLSSRGDHKQLGVGGEQVEAPGVALFDLADHGVRLT